MTASPFHLHAPFAPAGGQPDAIKKLIEGYKKFPTQTLLGITGSGKTYVMANVIETIGKPTLVLAHNKTLAAQLYQELKEFFPNNRVEYFISYYDYYQPESYIPTSDTYIEKEATINEQIEKMRLSTTAALLSRKDVIVVASISCIYGLGNPADFKEIALPLKVKTKTTRQTIITQLVQMQYERKDIIESGNFRVRGDTIDIYPPYDTKLIRIELFGDDIDAIAELDPITQERLQEIKETTIFAAKQFVVPQEKQERAMQAIRDELDATLPELPPLEAQRLEKRVKYDLEMMDEMGYCSGIENYSRHFDGRAPGTAPYTLLDYFGDEFLFIIDESHQTIPQSHGMYNGDFSRKKNLVDFGFRLPCAFDNRPLKFEEFERHFKHVVFVSATPSDYELKTSGQVVDLIIRPTGLLDPIVEVRPITGQVKNLIKEIKETTKRGFRILVTTLTKKMAEDLTNFFAKESIKVRYLHSEVQSLDRIEIIRQLRAGEFDVLVGINLLREGLDLPEVELVAILDADKEGFLRNTRSLIQTIGRAARNANGRVILYADRMTDSINEAIKITKDRRAAQEKFNKIHNITPKTILKSVKEKTRDVKGTKHMSQIDIEKQIIEFDAEMHKAAEQLDFEKAIALRDRIEDLKRSN